MIHGWDLHADRINIYFTTMGAEGEGRDPVKLALATIPPPPRHHTPVIYYWPFQGGTFIVVLFY